MRYITFPWEQLGVFLRSLSLSGGAGNAAAWILFAAAGCSPLLVWGLLAWRGKSRRADLLLPVLSLTLFAGLWFLANPACLKSYLRFPGSAGEEMGKYVFSAVIDSVLFSWLLLRFLKHCGGMDRRRLLRGMELLLGLYIAFSAAAVLFQGAGELTVGFKAMGENLSSAGDGWMAGWNPEAVQPAGAWLPGAGSSAIGGDMGARSIAWSRIVLVLQVLCRYLPDTLELVLCGAGIGFLRSCEQESFHEKSLKRAEQLKRWSVCFLGLTLGANICVNLLQLLLAGYLYSSHYSIVFPLEQILVMLGVTLLSRFWLEGKALKDDSALFI